MAEHFPHKVFQANDLRIFLSTAPTAAPRLLIRSDNRSARNEIIPKEPVVATKMKLLDFQREAATSKDERIIRIDAASGILTRKIVVGLQIFLLLMQPCVAFAEGAAGAGS